MLRNESSASPEVKLELTLTPEHIEIFYQIIVKGSLDPQEPCSGSLKLFKKNLLEFLQDTLRNSVKNEKTFELKRRILLDQMKAIHDKQFFQNKIDSKIIHLIQNEISQNCTQLKKHFLEEDCDDWLSTLRNIQTSQESSVLQNIPQQIRTGLSSAEIKSISFQGTIQPSMPGLNLNATGLQHFNKEEWDQAILFFKQARDAENEMCRESKKDVDENLLTIYQRNIAIAYYNWGMSCLLLSGGLFTVECFTNAITELNKVGSQFWTKEDTIKLVDFKRNLSAALNLLGLEYYYKDILESAVKYYKDAISEFYKINEAYRNEDDEENLEFYFRNLAHAFDQLGVQRYHEEKYDEAICCHEEAIHIFQKNLSSLTRKDERALAYCLRNLAFVRNEKGLVFFNDKQFSQAKNEFETSMSILAKIEQKYFDSRDFNARQVYQNNYNSALAFIEHEISLSKNSYAFFNPANIEPDLDVEVKPRPFKKRRL